MEGGCVTPPPRFVAPPLTVLHFARPKFRPQLRLWNMENRAAAAWQAVMAMS